MKISKGGIYLRGNIWWYYLTKDGERQIESLHTSVKSKALQEFYKIRENLLLGIDQRMMESIPFSDLWKKYQALELSKKAPATRDRVPGLVKRLLNFFGDKPVSRITRENVQEFIVACKNLKPNSINKYVATLSQILSAGIEWGYLKENPVKSSRPIKVREEPIPYLSDEQIAAILSKCNNFYRVLVIFLLETGARVSEAMRLTWNNIDFERDLITLRGKTQEVRSVPMLERLKKEFEGLSRIDQRVFPRALVTIKNQVPGICKRAGCPGISCHTFRHTSISRMVSAGVDLRTVMQWSGHRRLETLQKYAHLAPGFMDKVRGKLGYKY